MLFKIPDPCVKQSKLFLSCRLLAGPAITALLQRQVKYTNTWTTALDAATNQPKIISGGCHCRVEASAVALASKIQFWIYNLGTIR